MKEELSGRVGEPWISVHCFSRELEENVSRSKKTCVIMNGDGESTNLQGGGRDF